MNELRLIFLAYLALAREWARTHFYRKKVSEYHSSIKYFKKGDYVETSDGTRGIVVGRYVKISTGKPVGCSVRWEGTYKGEKITPYVPAIDKSPQYNPIIRKVI